MKNKISVFWFRRDLRLEDNAGLHHALSSGFPVLPIFIFDPSILNYIENKQDRRVDYIHQALTAMRETLQKCGSALQTFYGNPTDIFKKLEQEYDILAVFCNRDYEPSAIERDTIIYNYFKEKNIPFKAYKDQVIFDKNELVKSDGTPYTVYTPYAKKWKETVQPKDYRPFSIPMENFYQQSISPIVSLKEIGFEKTDIRFVKPTLDSNIIDHYNQFRDFPALRKTTQLGIALRFGTISIRQCVDYALKHNDVWHSELIWRSFFMQILYHFPKVVHQSFKSKYEHIQWRNDEAEFERWCSGTTGYPLVDAGMRQLNTTGFMHNRVRMVTASFLCKHLLIDWRWGEAYFAQKLNDFDLSANNGNWQWAAGCGCDAAPYFRIFNPTAQLEKFDKNHAYIRQWIPEIDTENYPQPIVKHEFARKRALETYEKAVKEK